MDAEIEGELARMKVRRFKIQPSFLLFGMSAPRDGQIVQATVDADGNFIFTVRSNTFSPVADGEEIPFV